MTEKTLPPEGVKFFDIPFSELTTATPFDTTPHATLYRYRFLDCTAFVNHHRLVGLEFTSLPTAPYACTSYPWLGLPPLSSSPSELGEFLIKGIELSLPVGLTTLMTACRAALTHDCNLIWFDRLSIVQTSIADKNWQIQRMGRIYRESTVCFAILGGLRRLARLDERTSWATRAWTLQEALLPKKTYCLFEWTEQKEIVHTFNCSPPVVLEKGVSGIASLKNLLGWCHGGLNYSTDDNEEFEKHNVDIIGPQETYLTRAAAFAVYGHEKGPDPQRRDGAIWRSAWIRTASRPVDMIFSIMGLFDVELDPAGFEVGDRAGATIALARELMRKGRRATWLGISFDLPPLRVMSTMPAFPVIGADGKFRVPEQGGAETTLDKIPVHLDWMLHGAPKGEVDEKGYFHFTARAMPVREVNRADAFFEQASNEYGKRSARGWDHLEEWSVEVGPSQVALPDLDKTYAVVVGRQNPIEFGEGGTFIIPNPVVLMIIEPDAAGGTFHRTAFCQTYLEVIEDWCEYSFVVGGPEDHSVASETQYSPPSRVFSLHTFPPSEVQAITPPLGTRLDTIGEHFEKS